MSVDHFYFHWFMRDGRPWCEHECLNGVETWQLPSPWRLNDEGGITPSLRCMLCGRHTILHECDRIDDPDDMDAVDKMIGGTVDGRAAGGDTYIPAEHKMSGDENVEQLDDARLQRHYECCPYAGNEWWCMHFPEHTDSDTYGCYEADGLTERAT